MLNLNAPPDGVSATTWQGEASAPPKTGDLWLLSWDGQALALALISSVFDNFVTCWPTTLRQNPVFAPAFLIEATPLHVPLLVWPTRETGVGLHMLHRRFGTMLSDRALIQTEESLENPERAPLPLVSLTVGGQDAEVLSDEMVDMWEEICLNVWPRPVAGVTMFSAESLRSAGLTITDIKSLIGVGTPEAVALFRAELAPSVEQLMAVANASQVDPYALLESGTDEASRLLIEPTFKNAIVGLALMLEISEAGARGLAQAEFALAARSDGGPRARMSTVIERLGAEGRSRGGS